MQAASIGEYVFELEKNGKINKTGRGNKEAQKASKEAHREN